ncbi:MAG: uroporphyrinogen decarboxylase [Lachnospiraceae bacterium]|nr:uroporphyrinogen decarboxylase [Lachnospiraceae bacterium]
MGEMTSLERIRAVMRGETPDHLPVVPQSFMFAMSDGGYSIGTVNRKPAVMAKCHLECREKYGYDGCIMDVDDSTLAEACGAKVIYREDNVAVVKESEPLLKDLRQIDDLKLPDPKADGRLPEWLETTSRIAEKIGREAIVMGRADQGPFNLLCILRGTQEFMMDLFEEDEEVIFHALEWCAKAHISFAKAQLEAGANITSMGDAYASPNLVSPAIYQKFALPYERQVVEAVQTEDLPYSIHICGDTTKIIGAMGRTGARLLEVDWKLDMETARKEVPADIVLMGNVNPSDPLYLGSPEDVDAAVRAVVEATKGYGLIISSGCAIGANTSPENMRAFVAAARRYGACENIMELRHSAIQ